MARRTRGARDFRQDGPGKKSTHTIPLEWTSYLIAFAAVESRLPVEGFRSSVLSLPLEERRMGREGRLTMLAPLSNSSALTACVSRKPLTDKSPRIHPIGLGIGHGHTELSFAELGSK